MKTRRVALVSSLRTGRSGGIRTVLSGSFIALFALIASSGIAQELRNSPPSSPPVHVTRPQHGNYGPVLPRTGTTTRSKLKPELQPPPAANTSTWQALGPAALNAPVGAQIGPFNGTYASGRITGVTVDPSNPLNIYIAAAGGGVWNTNDGGATWTSLTDNQATLSMGSIAVAPNAPQTIYAGTGEANNSADSNHGMGILVSSDGGAMWTLSQGPGGVFNGLSVGKIAVDPTDPLTAYAAMNDDGWNGGCYAVPSNCSGTGVYKTSNGGLTWARVTPTGGYDGSNTWSDVVVDPDTPNVIYAAQGNYVLASDNGVYRSTDSGATWLEFAGIPNGRSAYVGRIALAAGTGHVLYIAMAYSSDDPYTDPPGNPLAGTLLFMGRIDNANAISPATPTPTNLTADTPNFCGSGAQGWYDLVLGVDPSNSTHVFAAGAYDYNNQDNAILESTTAGASWNDITTEGGVEPHTNYHAMAFDSSNRLLVGNDGGIWRYDTGFWTNLNGDLNTIQFYGISLHPTNPQIVLGGSQDNGSELYTGNPVWNEVTGGDGGYANISQTNPNVMYTTYTQGVTYASVDGGNTFPQVFPYPGLTINQSLFNLITPTIADPANGDRLLIGGDYIWETLDDGADWFAHTNPSGLPPDSVAVLPGGNTIYIAAGGTFNLRGFVYRSDDDGNTWTAAAYTTPNSYHIHEIDIDPNDPTGQTAVAVIDRADPTSGHVFRTTTGGATWTDITGNLPAVPTWSAKIDIDANQTIYVSNDTGVYAAPSPYANWTPLGAGLPNAQGFNLQLNENPHELGLATHGRGAWLIGSLSISKSLTPAVIETGQTSVVTLTLTNTTGSLQNQATFTDTLVNMQAAGGAVTGTCAATPATLAAGATALSFSAISLPDQGTCTVIFSVTSYTPGVQTNTTSGVTGSALVTPLPSLPSNTVQLTVFAPVQITISTTSANLLVSVDGGTATVAPLVETWVIGSSHTIATTSPQSGGTGVQYVFSSWSDSGAISHSITVPSTATTYTAAFSTQYQLTTAANPTAGGTVAPTSGNYYTSGTIVPLTATANAGYTLTNWTGNVANSISASTSITMTAPQSVTANFSLIIVATPTTTSVSSNNNPSFTTAPGNSVTFTATVTSNSTVNEGTVTFSDPANNFTCSGGNTVPVSNGQAACTTSFTTEGSQNITGTYNGTVNFQSSNGFITQTVNNHTTGSGPGGTGNQWCNTGSISIPGAAGAATPYASQIFVTATENVGALTVNLNGISSSDIPNTDLLLVGPTGAQIIPFAKVGDGSTISGVNITLDDSGGNLLPAGSPLSTGTFKATSRTGGTSLVFPAPAPSVTAANYAATDGSATLLSVFGSTNAKGTWSLYAMANSSNGAASIGRGWCVNITPVVPAPTITVTNVIPSSEVYGQDAQVTISAVLSWPGTGPAPTASDVTIGGNGPNISYSGTTCTALGGNTMQCSATYTPSALDVVGTYTETATFTGDNNYLAASSTQTNNFSITQASTSTSVGSGQNPSITGQPVTFTATIDGQYGEIVRRNGASLGGGSSKTSLSRRGLAGNGAAHPLSPVGGINGSVTWSLNTGCGTTPVSGEPGTSQCTTSTLPQGTDPITANYSGDGNHTGSNGTLSGGQVVNPAIEPTAIAVNNVSPGSEGYGQDAGATITAVLSWTGTGPAPTASDVSISTNASGGTLGTTTCGTASGNAMTCTATFTPGASTMPGLYTMSASFSGDSNYSASSSTQNDNFSITKATSSTSLSLTGGTNPSTYGSSVTFSATIDGEYGMAKTGKGLSRRGRANPESVGGFVTWSANTGCSQSPVPSLPATVTCTTTALPTGPNTVAANYSGDIDHTGSSNTIGQTVSQQITAITVSNVSPSSEGYGQDLPVTITAVLTWTGSGTPPMASGVSISANAPGGSLGATSCGIPSSDSLTCTATFTPNGITVDGAYIMSASFAGDGNYGGSGSPQNDNFSITKATSSTSVSLTGGTNPSGYGSSVTFTATIDGEYGMAKTGKRRKAGPEGVTSGSVTWSANTGCAVSPVTSLPATVTCTTPALPAGADTVLATYSGDSNHSGSSGSVGQTVSQQTPTINVANVIPSSEVYGQDAQVTITAVLSWTGNGAAPTASDVAIGGNAPSNTYGTTSCGVPSSNTITCTNTYTPTAADIAGTYTMSARFTGDSNYSSSSSTQTNNFSISGATSSTSVISNLNPSLVGQSVMFTATIDGEYGLIKVRNGAMPVVGVKQPGTHPLSPTGGSVTWSTNTGCSSSPVTSLPATVTCTTSALPAGTDTITASYSGDNNHSGSMGTLSGGQAVDQAPAITSANKTTFTAGVAGSFTVTTTGYPTPSIGESGALPTGVSFVDNHNGTGTLSGTPTTGGVFNVSFTASNGVGSNATQLFTLTVPQAPLITSANNATFTIGVAGSFTVTTMGYPAPSLTETGHIPTGLMFVDNGNGTGTLSGTPVVFGGGLFPITITAKNGVGSAVTQNFTIILQQPPSFTSANSATFAYGVANSFTVTTTGFPAPSIAESGALPPGVTFVDNHNGTATLSGTPSAGGSFPLVLTATNVASTTQQSFTLNVSGLNVSPQNLTFGTLYLNGSSTMSVTVTNVGGSTVTVTGESITPGTANAATYKAVSHCGSPLKPGKSCTISVTFLANLEGTLTATMHIMDNGFGTPQQVNLTGNVIDPVAQFNPTKLSFGTEAVHSGKTLPVQLTNSGQTPLDISNISIGGTDAGDFSQTNNCPAILSSTMSCTISVTFTPSVKGARAGTLIVTDNVAAGQSTVALTGTGH